MSTYSKNTAHVLGPGQADTVILEDAETAITSNVLRIVHRSTGTPAAGLGAAISLEAEDSAGNDQPMGVIRGSSRVATDGAEDGYLAFGVVASGTMQAAGSEAILIQSFAGYVSTVTRSEGSATAILQSVAVTEFNTTGTAAAGMGPRQAYRCKDDAGTKVSIGGTSFSLVSAAAGAVSSTFKVQCISAGTFPADAAPQFEVRHNSTVVCGAPVALATTAQDGDLYIPACAGTPTGVPTAVTGKMAVRGDETNNKLYFYSGGAWRDSAGAA